MAFGEFGFSVPQAVQKSCTSPFIDEIPTHFFVLLESRRKNDRFAFRKSSSGGTPALPSKTLSTPVLNDSLKNFLCTKQSTYQSKRPQGIRIVKPFINNNLMFINVQK